MYAQDSIPKCLARITCALLPRQRTEYSCSVSHQGRRYSQGRVPGVPEPPLSRQGTPPPPPRLSYFYSDLSQEECNGLAIPEILRFVLSLQLVIVFTAGPAFEDLFNTCKWFLLDINTVHTNVKKKKKKTIEYLLKLTSK